MLPGDELATAMVSVAVDRSPSRVLDRVGEHIAMVATRRADGGRIAVGAVSEERQRAEGAHDCRTRRRIHRDRSAAAQR